MFLNNCLFLAFHSWATSFIICACFIVGFSALICAFIFLKNLLYADCFFLAFLDFFGFLTTIDSVLDGNVKVVANLEEYLDDLIWNFSFLRNSGFSSYSFSFSWHLL